jgi:hypothetical protein
MINKLLLVLLVLLSVPNYSQELIVKDHQQSIPLNSNLTKQFHYFEKNDLSDKTQKTNELNNGNLIWITDLNLNYRINPGPQTIVTDTYRGEVTKYTRDEGGQFYLTSDLGALKKINENIGFGISHYLGIGGGLRAGIKLKYRQWLKNGSFIDISPGIIYFNWDNESPGFTSSIDWWKNEYFALTVLIEYLPPSPDYFQSYETNEGYIETQTEEYEKDFGIYFGIKTGSKAGLIGNGIYYGIILYVATGLMMMSGSG